MQRAKRLPKKYSRCSMNIQSSQPIILQFQWLRARKSEQEKFPGAEETYTFEA